MGLSVHFSGTDHPGLTIHRLRQRAAQKRPVVTTLSEELEQCLPTPRRYPLPGVEYKELLTTIEDFLHQQKRDDRMMFIRRYWYCEEIATIARQMGTTEGRVKSSLFRIRNRLRQRLIEEAYERLLDGHYLGLPGYGKDSPQPEERVDLLYYADWWQTVSMPYYRFYVYSHSFPKQEGEGEIKVYEEYYVPAVHSDYLTVLPQDGVAVPVNAVLNSGASRLLCDI